MKTLTVALLLFASASSGFAQTPPTTNVTLPEPADNTDLNIEVPDISNPFISKLPKKPQPVSSPADVVPQPPPPVQEETVPVENNNLPPEQHLVVQRPNINVQGVIWGGDVPQAIIDGHIVSVGDKISPSQSSVDNNRVPNSPYQTMQPGTNFGNPNVQNQEADQASAQIEITEITHSQVKVLYQKQTFIYEVQ